MKLTFKKIIIKNFLSYQEEEFDFSEHKGINLICGKNLDIPESKNGCGKSSLGNALVYGLYGKLPYKLKNENLSNRYLEDKNMSITLFFSVDSKKYKTHVGLRRGKSSFFNLYEISKEGNEHDITKATLEDTREFLANEILHCDINLFMRTILLNTDPEYNFYNLGKQEKKDFIDRLFDTAIYGDMYDLIRSSMNSLSKEILAHQNQIMVLNKNDEEYDQKILDFNTSKENIIKDLNDKFSEAKQTFDEKSEIVVKKNTDLISKLTNELKELNEKKSSLQMELQQKKYEKQNITSEVSSIKNMISDKKKLITKHKTILSKVCDNCKTTVANHYNLISYQREITKLEGKLKTLEDKCNEFPDLNKIYVVKINDIIGKINEITIEINNQNYEYNKSQDELRRLENSMNYIKSQLESTINSVNPFIELSETNKNKILEESKIIDDLKEDYKYKKYSSEIVDQENLKKSIIRELITLLNSRIKTYLDRLGTSFEIVFDEDMNYEFITDTNANPEFHNFSSGEQARISFATCFAFKDFLSNRSGLTSNILILDEFIDGNVDSMAIDNIMEIVKEYSKKNNQNIYIVSHRKEIDSGDFNNNIEIVKKDHISKIYITKNV